jgi:hypothetical protein
MISEFTPIISNGKKIAPRTWARDITKQLKLTLTHLGNIDPAILPNADDLAERLMVQATRLYQWAEKHGEDAQSRMEAKTRKKS